MNIRELFYDNISEYADHIDPDIAENISRMYYHGIAALPASLWGVFCLHRADKGGRERRKPDGASDPNHYNNWLTKTPSINK